MTANASKLQSLLWKVEASWGETATSMAAAARLTITEPIDVSGLQHAQVEPARATQYLNETTAGIPGVMGGSFSFSVYLCGNEAAGTGAIALTTLGNLLGWGLGANYATPAAGTTVSGGASTVSSAVTVASGTYVVGQMYRIGAKGDTTGDGQANVVLTHTLTALNGKFKYPAAPANADVVYSGQTVYTLEDPTAGAMTGYRFLILTANTQWLCHGCYPTGVTLSGLGPGEIPKATFTVGVSWFEPRAATFPDTTALTTSTPSPVAAGSWNLQTYGTTDRNALTLRAHSIDVALGMAPLMGNDGVNSYQTIVGATRLPTKVMVNATIDAAAATTSPTYWADWFTNGTKHILGTLSTVNGQSLSYYCPVAYWRGARPTQMADGDLNRLKVSFEAGTDTAAATALAQSAFRIGLT